jgi:DNA polymerase elongation subunit (family B)
MACFFRRDGKVIREDADFRPFIVMAEQWRAGLPVAVRAHTALSGANPINCLVEFDSWKDCLKAREWLAKETGFSASDPASPYLFLSDPVQQYLSRSGQTLFRGMHFGDLRRMQIDIECRTSPGYEFCNAEREGDSILAIGMADSSGWRHILSSTEMSEKDMIVALVQCIKDRDPDVIEGHNLFNFDLPYIACRAKRWKVPLAIGRDGSCPHSRPGRFTAGERTITYERCEVFGRHIVDTFLLAHAYDVSHRSFDGFGLKEVAAHLGLSAEDRELIPGDAIGTVFETDPRRVLRYLEHDVLETGRLSEVLSRSQFVQAQMLPFSYQSVCVRGNAARIDALIVREYLRRRISLPVADTAREFEGGYTDIFATGIIADVHHCDVRSLYPSIMLSGQLGPRRDEAGAFLEMLRVLTQYRVAAKGKAKSAPTQAERTEWDAVQTTFKTLINSFYGYLGFGQVRFSDFDQAEAVTRRGREILRHMVEQLKALGAKPIEIDTDGVYFVPPGGLDERATARFQSALAERLPDGIEVEFDGHFRAMFSYRMKNYALLGLDGNLTIKGAALKSRGLEPFQRRFMRELLRMRLSGKDAEVPALKAEYEDAIRNRRWPIRELAKTETLQEAPASYKAKTARSARARNAAYELALASGREYRAGDQVAYYVTGTRKSVAVHEAAKLVSDWNAEKRDENVAYYLAKLDALYAKFAQEETQDELDLS